MDDPDGVTLETLAEAVRSIRRPRGRGATRIGWVVADTLELRRPAFWRLSAPNFMRVANTARWLNANDPELANEMYDPRKRYDAVVFFKAMGERYREEARRIQASGGKVVFDANVNYYEVGGDYEIPGTKPTADQTHNAHEMTATADWVVADSTYLLGIVKEINPRSSWVPDNVDLGLFRGERSHAARRPVRLVWSGIAKKAVPLLGIRAALAGVADAAELVIFSEEAPHVLAGLQEVIRCRYEQFRIRRYARMLPDHDVIISPKNLVNLYELGHTEWKISCGMAVGLPAVASPQQSYVDALSEGGGIIASTPEEWTHALRRIVDDVELRARLGGEARRIVEERYSTPVVSRQYGQLLRELAR